MKNDIIFILNDSQKIIFELKDKLPHRDCCTEAQIVFKNHGCEITLGSNSVKYNISILHNLLTKAFKNNLPVHSSITQDFGYLYNQYTYCIYTYTLKESALFVYETKGKDSWWVGENNNLWDHEFFTWLYNDHKEAIIFEITPLYPRFSLEDGINESDFNNWMAQYKPYLITTIPHDIAQQWLEQTEFVLKTIEENIKRFEAEAKAAEAGMKALQ